MKKCVDCGKPVERPNDGYNRCKACNTEMKRQAFIKFGMFPKVNKNVEATVRLMNETVTD